MTSNEMADISSPQSMSDDFEEPSSPLFWRASQSHLEKAAWVSELDHPTRFFQDDQT